MKTTKLAKVAAPIFDALRNSGESDRWIGLVDQAKLIRAAVADAFPGTKFSVTSSSYSGGCSIDIRWQDGPKFKEVDAVVGAYEGGGFDGMIDLAYSTSRWFSPDGTAAFAHTSGTAGSGGTVPEAIGDPHHPSALLVRFSAKYVHTHRSYSLAAKRDALARLCGYWAPLCELKAVPYYRLRNSAYSDSAELSQDIHVGGEYLSTLVYRVLEGTMLEGVSS